ncbi:MAG: hypothetical protein OXT09_00605, partial [Myxococcales bacterium]|nr:hypothetical protein [Myxococcales bacterium]
MDAGPTDAHPDPDGGTADLAHPVSEFCGDGIRDPVTEECDDGTALEDPCSADCRVREAALLAPTTPPQASLERLRGHGPHNMASHGESSIAVVYVERTSSSAVHAQFLDGWGGRTADPVELSAGGSPTTEPNPVVAPLPGDRYAFAWTDAASGTPDILLQSAPAGAPPTSSPQLAHETSSGPQQDPDMLWVGDELIVTWSALLDVHYRRFDAQLRPLGPSQPLAATADIDSFPTLARFGDTWAAAFRVVSDGLQS